jgi:glucose/arabinose dehydrogenase
MRRRLGGALGIVLLASTVAIGAGRPASAAPNIDRKVRLVKVIGGLAAPMAVAWRDSQSGMYVAQQGGSVVRVKSGKVVGTALTVSVETDGGEQGLLGLAFSADGTKMYVDYTAPGSGDIKIVEYTMAGVNANPATARVLMTIPHSTFANHNGGALVMSGGLLYISVGDGGGGGDSLGNGQNKNSLLAKILRIDPKPSLSLPYTIPPSNPWVGMPNARAETWMWGLRNPWRFSIDRKTKAMWIGDVGQGLYEEIDYAKAGEKGINWGWPLREGFHPYNGAQPPGGRDPILERAHSSGDCAIVGGYVYRGKAVTGFNGVYVHGDACTGKLRALTQQGGKVVRRRALNLTVPGLASFGEGRNGEMFVISRFGDIYRLGRG